MGKKDPSRKKPKRKQIRPSIDADLAELASVLDLNREPQDPSLETLFGPPWRDGWNAARLAKHCWSRFQARINHPEMPLVHQLFSWIHARETSGMIYELAETAIARLRSDLALDRGSDPANVFLLAGLRCVQLVIANSHGGGDVFNAALRSAFAASPEYWLRQAMESIIDCRCQDAIGTHIRLSNDMHDRVRNAFSIAWNRGLYQAAYALPRVA